MREGYKKTQVGVIPEDWEVKYSSDVFNVITDYVANGSFASLNENVIYKDKEDYAVLIRLTDYKNGYKDSFVYVDKNAYEFLEKSKLEPEDIIIANVGAYAGYVFKAPKWNRPMTLGPNAILVRSNEVKDYIYYWLSSEIGQKRIGNIISTTAQPKFNKTDFKRILIPIPPQKEQEKIAEILSTVDSQIDDTEKLIEKSKELKKGLMQKLLTKGIGHSEFKKTEVAEIPAEWEVKKLEEVTRLIKDGTHNPPVRVDKGIPLLSAENIFNRKVNYGINEKNISINDYNNIHKNYTIDKGDILMTIVGTIGRVAVVQDDNKFTVQRSVAIIKSGEDLSNEYLSYFLESDICKRDLYRRSNCTAQAGLYLGELGKIKIILPSLDEQEKIADILSIIDNEIEEYENKKQKLELLKNGLMQQLLTGKIRIL